jgi:hypothetical protein
MTDWSRTFDDPIVNRRAKLPPDRRPIFNIHRDVSGRLVTLAMLCWLAIVSAGVMIAGVLMEPRP